MTGHSNQEWNRRKASLLFVALAFLLAWFAVGLFYMWPAQVMRIGTGIRGGRHGPFQTGGEGGREDIRRFVDAVRPHLDSFQSALIVPAYRSFSAGFRFYYWAQYFALPDAFFMDGRENAWTAITRVAVFKDHLSDMNRSQFCRVIGPRESTVCSVRPIANLTPAFTINTHIVNIGDSVNMQLIARSMGSEHVDPVIAMMATVQRVGYTLIFDRDHQRSRDQGADIWVATLVLHRDVAIGRFFLRLLTLHKSGRLWSHGLSSLDFLAVR